VFSVKNNTNPRLGLSIAKKILKRAVDRNKFKRLAREVFRLNQTQLPNKDFVVMVNKNKELNLIDNKTLTQELKTLLQ